MAIQPGLTPCFIYKHDKEKYVSDKEFVLYATLKLCISVIILHICKHIHKYDSI